MQRILVIAFGLSVFSMGPVYIEPVQISGRTTYRVRVGPIANVTKADRLAQQLSDLGLETPRIVIE